MGRSAASSNPEWTYIGVLRHLLPYLKAYWKTAAVSLVLTFLGAALAQITPLAVNHLVNELSRVVEGTALSGDGWRALILIGLVLLVKELAVFAVNYLSRYLGERLKVNVGADLSNSVYSHLLALDMSYFDQADNDVGRLTKRVDRGVDGLAKTVKNLFVDLLPLFVTAAAALVVMFSVNAWVGITSSFIIPIYAYLSFRQAQSQKGVRRQIQDTQEERTSAMFSVLSVMKLVKSFSRESFEARRHQSINAGLATSEIRHHQTNIHFDGLKLLIDRIGAVLIVSVTAVLILQGHAAVGAITLHLLLYDNITAPIRHLHRIYDESLEAVAYAEGFFSILATEPALAGGRESTEPGMERLSGSLEMRGVSFSYIPGREILHEISLLMPAGKTIALIGLSGAGKTTIANLLSRFYDPDSGEILLDGRNLKDYSLSYLRRTIGLVLQESHIFPGTIAENIRYGNLSASDEEVQDAARQAGLDGEVAAMTDGYDTDARRLSGGQKQRIALARVFLKNPSILILDEPTASLDAIAAERIQGALRLLRRSRTVLIISHNLASIVDADTIYVIRDGRIVGGGTHNSLYRDNEHYRKLIDANIESMNLDKLMSVRSGQAI